MNFFAKDSVDNAYNTIQVNVVAEALRIVFILPEDRRDRS